MSYVGHVLFLVVNHPRLGYPILTSASGHLGDVVCEVLVYAAMRLFLALWRFYVSDDRRFKTWKDVTVDGSAKVPGFFSKLFTSPSNAAFNMGVSIHGSTPLSLDCFLIYIHTYIYIYICI